jgi:hypothetical protein
MTNQFQPTYSDSLPKLLGRISTEQGLMFIKNRYGGNCLLSLIPLSVSDV